MYEDMTMSLETMDPNNVSLAIQGFSLILYIAKHHGYPRQAEGNARHLGWSQGVLHVGVLGHHRQVQAVLWWSRILLVRKSDRGRG